MVETAVVAGRYPPRGHMLRFTCPGACLVFARMKDTDWADAFAGADEISLIG
jgi:hypothetical protein